MTTTLEMSKEAELREYARAKLPDLNAREAELWAEFKRAEQEAEPFVKRADELRRQWCNVRNQIERIEEFFPKTTEAQTEVTV